MAKLKKMIFYLYDNYPDKSTLSIERLKFMLYLTDWKSAIEHGHQMTNFSWEIQDGKLFLPTQYYSQLGVPNSVFRYVRYLFKYMFQSDKLTEQEVKTLNFVIELTSGKRWKELVQIVYSTYPTLGEQDVEFLDLKALATKYRTVLKRLGSSGYEPLYQ